MSEPQERQATPRDRLWMSLTTEEAAAAIERDPVLVLPLAAVEQHGPHLPLSTDLDIGMGLLTRAVRLLTDEAPVWCLPSQAITASAEHAGFPGTVTLTSGTLAEAIVEIGSGLAGSGVRRLVLANSHGGNRAAMDRAALELRRTRGMLVAKASYDRLGRPGGVDFPPAEWRHGLHGGAVETAMMLHLHPERVRTGQIADFPSLGADLEATLRRLGPEGTASFGWLAEDLNPAGAVGDARLATEEAGAKLVEHYAAALADVLRDAVDFPIERLSGGATG